MPEESHHLKEYGPVDRRKFLKISGMLGLGLAAYPLGPPLADAVSFDRELSKVSISRIGMGTMVSLTVLDPSKDRAHEAVERAFEEIERLTGLISRFDAGTPVARLNQEGFLKDVPPELSLVVVNSLYYHRISNGLFDITVKPILDLFARSSQGPHVLPPEEKIAEALELVDCGLISLDRGTIRFKKDGMGITLDGIAKGFIVDKAAESLMEQGIRHALINAGGDIRTIGDKGNHRPWRIAIQDPCKKRNYPSLVSLTNGSIATSGNYEVFFDQEKIYHHILNPRTGVSPLQNVSVSVQAPRAMEADALSTALFVLDPAGGMSLIDSRSRCHGLIITRDGRKIRSAGWDRMEI